MDVQPDLSRRSEETPPGGRNERHLAQGAGVQTAEQLLHGRVAGDGNLIDLLPRHARRGAKLADHFIDGLGNGRLQLPQGIAVGSRAMDARKDVVAEAGLRIQPRDHGQVVSRTGVQKRGGQRGGADIDGHGKGVPLGVAGLEIQEPAVGLDRRAAEVRLPQPLRQSAEQLQIDLHRTEGLLQPDEVGGVIAARRRGQLDIPLAHDRIDLGGDDAFPMHQDLLAGALQRRLRNQHARGPFDGALTRQPAARLQLVGREEVPFGGRGLAAAAGDHHAALAADGLAAAGRIQDQVGHGRRLQQLGPPQNVDGLFQRLKRDRDFRFTH